MQRISIDPKNQAPTRDLPPLANTPIKLPPAKTTKVDPSKPGANASLFFVGTATTIMFVPLSDPMKLTNQCSEWAGIRLMTDVSSGPRNLPAKVTTNLASPTFSTKATTSISALAYRVSG